MAWQGIVRVDEAAYTWLGANDNGTRASLLATEFTPTRTRFTISAGPVVLNVTFLSPIESLPFVYLAIDVIGIDGQSHDVQLYSDVSGEWVSGDRNLTMSWSTTVSDTTVYHQAARTISGPMMEINNVAEDAILYYGTPANPLLSWQTGEAIVLRVGFTSSGKLNNTQDNDFRAISDRWPVLAYAVDLGSITNSPSSTVFSLGLLRNPVITYSTREGQQDRSPYFKRRFKDGGDAADFFIRDYKNAIKRADALDQQIVNDASKISTNYADLVALSARQAMAGIDITIAKGNDNEWNMSDVKVFMKDTGISRRTSPIEKIFSAFPMLLYFNSSLGGLLLEPILELSGSSDFPPSDLGNTYPKASGNPSNGSMPIDGASTMLITALAHAQRSGDGTLIERHYDSFKVWARYLNSTTLHTRNQYSADWAKRDDMSNLAIKGIIGIAAMAKISQAMKRDKDFKAYSANAIDLYSQWVTLATSEGHISSVYRNARSFPLMYNLYADVLLQTHVVNRSLYASQTSFYDSLIVVALPFGIPYDSMDSTPVANAPWNIFTAATVTQNTTRDSLIGMVHNRSMFDEVSGNFPIEYLPDDGQMWNGSASPGQGAMFHRLPIRDIVVPDDSSSASARPRSKMSGTIIGVIVGGTIVGAAFLALIFWYWCRRLRSSKYSSVKVQPYPLRFPIREKPSQDQKLNLPKMPITPDSGKSHHSSNVVQAGVSIGDNITELRAEIDSLRDALQSFQVVTTGAPPEYTL
ncbi:hypothetical protein V5O48_010000 [Marasmius crinis-equi]|uniref:DUF1793-domain-containing protein n=1 Tax=Marasmius crinis-equi TaxID=585013 RepID=A0ABR3F9L2_9AGAR